MSFWQGKGVLVTGADGFLGANLTKALIAAGARVVTFTRTGISPHSLLALEGLTNKIAKQELGSVTDFDLLASVMQNHNLTVVYHLAALPLVEVGQGNPLPTFEVNIKGTWNVLEAVRRTGVEKVVAVSTTHVYGDNPRLPYREVFYPQPSRPYETSKAAADLLAQCYADTYQLGVEIPRFVNVYGPGDSNFSRIVPKIIKTVLLGESPKLWDTSTVRDFLYVDDAVAALLTIVEKNLHNRKRNRIFNFGSGKPVSITDLVKKIVALSGEKHIKVVIEPAPEDREKEILRQYVSIAKAKAELNWQPEVSLKEGLSQTIAWYRKYLSHYEV